MLFFWLVTLLDGHAFPFADRVPRSTTTVFLVVSSVGFIRTAAVPVLYEVSSQCAPNVDFGLLEKTLSPGLPLPNGH